jgi:hypothetical protein
MTETRTISAPEDIFKYVDGRKLSPSKVFQQAVLREMENEKAEVSIKPTVEKLQNQTDALKKELQKCIDFLTIHGQIEQFNTEYPID